MPAMPQPSAADKKNLNKIAAKIGEQLQQVPIEKNIFITYLKR